MSKSSRGELVVIGDSFSVDYIAMRNTMHIDNDMPYRYSDSEFNVVIGEWEARESFPIWGEIVATELDLKLVNLSQSAIGTDFIFAEALDYITKNKKNIERVIIIWSSFSRFDFERPNEKKSCYNPTPWTSINTTFNPQGDNANLLEGAREINALSFEAGINNFFRHIYTLQVILKSYNISYTMAQSVNDESAFNGGYIKYAKKILNNPYFDLIDDESFIGWPGTKSLGGFNIGDLIWSEDDKNHISCVDKHPNENGMKIIAKAILDF